MKTLKRLAIAALTLLLVPLLIELVIQLLGDPRAKELTAQAKERPAYWDLARAGVLVQDDESLRFRLRPGFTATVNGIEYRIDELGLRGGPIVRPKPAGVRRVLVAGDSYAFGLGVTEADALSAQLESRLRAAPSPVEVVNFGIPAYQTGQEVALLERLGFALEPDLVVLLYYPNDNVEAPLSLAPSIGALYVDELPLPYSWKPLLSRSYLYSLLAKLDASRRLDRGEFEARGERNWPITKARLQAFAAACRAHDVAFLLAPLPELSSRSELADDTSQVSRDHARVLSLAQAEAWPTIDLRTGLLQRERVIEKLFLSLHPLDNHLNPTGHAILADLIAPTAQRLLH